MGTLVLCCGQVLSGKSTFARTLEGGHGFVYFSADTWMFHFYEHSVVREVFANQLSRCKDMIYQVSEQLLKNNVPVVLDFGFWRKEEREGLRQKFSVLGHKVVSLYFKSDVRTQVAFMKSRQGESDPASYSFDREAIEALNAHFEAPEGDEECLSPQQFLRSLGEDGVQSP